jgi:hypothetical protein
LRVNDRPAEEKIILLKRKLHIATQEKDLNILKIKEIFKEISKIDVTRGILKRSDILSLLRFLRDEKFPNCKVREYSTKVIDYWKNTLQK